MFADDYPKFIEVSELTSGPNPKRAHQDHRTAEQQRNRMNARYEAMFAANRDIFEGARVLDLASHDGRYSFAALRTGAAHVTGIEVRQSLVDRAHQCFEHYEQDPSTYRFLQGDIFETLAREELDVDVVLNFGFMYHTYRHTELMYRMHQLAPRHLVIDTMVTRDRRPTLRMIRERDVEDIRSAAPDPWSVGRVLVLRPSVPALELMVRSYGFEVQSSYDWKARLAGGPEPGLEGYARGQRVTVRCISREAARETGWSPEPSPTASVPSPRPAVRPSAPSTPHRAGWRDRVNGALARTTGYELHRAADRS